jgi:DNA-binding transcriptional ArsR family regulator
MNMIGKQKQNTEIQQEEQLFKVLSHPARLAILDELRRDEACVCHLEAKLGYRQAYLSQQLSVLRDAGLITDRKDGWNVYYRTADEALYQVLDAARKFMKIPEMDLQLEPLKDCPCPKCTGNKNKC